jgi:hypothetical protein
MDLQFLRPLNINIALIGGLIDWWMDVHLSRAWTAGFYSYAVSVIC